MTIGLKKWSDYQALTGAVLRGDESFLIADTASAGTVTAATISATASTDTIADSGAGLPVCKVGALVLLSGFVDASTELNGLHAVVSSTASALVVATDITSDEAAGASVTVSEVVAMYELTAAEFAAYVGTAGLPDSFAVDYITANVHDNGASGTFNRNNGEVQKCTLTGAGVALTFTNVPEGGMCRAAISGAATYAPDISAMAGKWRGGVEPTYDALTIISAVNDNGTLRYIAGGSWSS